MGGGGSDTTNVTNTGLGDEQYKALADNQVGISNQVAGVGADAKAAYDKFGTRFNTIDGTLGGLSTTMLDQFKAANTNVNNLGTTLGGRFTSLDTATKQNNDAIGGVQQATDAVGRDVTGGFKQAQERFNTIDQANTDLQTSVNTGFVDQAQAFSDLNTNIGDATTGINDNLTTNFAATNDALANAQTNIRSDVTTAQSNILGGQGDLANSLSDLGANQDIYYGATADAQANMQAGQDEFRSNFDSYVDRYATDTTLANQTRADLQTAQANSADRIRTDLGNFAQASATGQAGLSSAINDVAAAGDQGFAALGSTVEGGFSQQSANAQQSQMMMADRIGNVKSLLQTTGANLDAQTKAQYSSLANSFDNQGNLIQNSIADNGDVLRRNMDAQGNLIETRFDQAGNQVGQVSTNVNQVLSSAEQNQQQLSTQMGGFAQDAANGFNAIGSSMEQGFNTTGQNVANLFDTQTSTLSQQGMKTFSDMQANLDGMDAATQAGFKTVASSFDAQGNLVRSATDAMGNNIQRSMDAQGNLIEQQFDTTGNLIGTNTTSLNDMMSKAQAYQTQTMQGQTNLQNVLGNQLQTNQQGLMAQLSDNTTTYQNQYDQLSQKLQGGFQNLGQADITQTRDLAKIAATQTDLDMGMRQNFQQLGNAFDDTGALIRNSIDAQGNTISRAVDQNGNLMLKSFDATGRDIGTKVININKSLMDLGNLKTVAGSNISMGNLSPASQGAVPTSGFMSPFTQTR